MERDDGYIGKRILVIFEDGSGHYSKKEGICSESNSYSIILDNKHIIPKMRIYRAEVKDENS